jgi:hypothetical protein
MMADLMAMATDHHHHHHHHHHRRTSLLLQHAKAAAAAATVRLDKQQCGSPKLIISDSNIIMTYSNLHVIASYSVGHTMHTTNANVGPHIIPDRKSYGIVSSVPRQDGMGRHC